MASQVQGSMTAVYPCFTSECVSGHMFRHLTHFIYQIGQLCLDIYHKNTGHFVFVSYFSSDCSIYAVNLQERMVDFLSLFAPLRHEIHIQCRNDGC